LLVNKSGYLLDSAIITIFSAKDFSIKMKGINPNDTIVNIIPRDMPESNKHDITIEITAYINGEKPISDFRYNDLTGYLTSDYLIVIDDKRKIEWKILE
jgi:hypothetical protein